MAVKILQLHKRASYEYKYIQDKYAFSQGQDCFALADGTTQSFNSEDWAKAITEKFIETPIFEAEALISEFSKIAKVFKEKKYNFSSNPAKASLEKDKLKRGATSTFLGVRLNEENQLSIISCGDSNIFIVRNNNTLALPFTSIQELDRNKYFLNTEDLVINKVEASFFITKTIQLETNDVIILATDALSRLLLKHYDSYKDFIQIDCFNSLQNICVKYWDEKKLEEDDITAIVILKFESKALSEILPPTNFSFPKEVEIVFEPSPKEPPFAEQKNKNEMQQNLFTLNRINEELITIKKKSKFHEILLMLAISLIAFNLFFLYNLKQSDPPENVNEQPNLIQKQLTEKDKIIQSLKAEIQKLNKLLVSKNDTVNVDKKSAIKPPLNVLKDINFKKDVPKKMEKIKTTNQVKDSIKHT